MKITQAAALFLLAGGIVAAQQATLRDPQDAALQIRLDRPAGGGSGGGGGAAAPSSGLVADVTAEDVARIIKGLNYTSVSAQKQDKFTFVRADIGDQPTYIMLNNCGDNGRCSALYFIAYLGKQDSVDAEFMNDYNRNTMFTKMAKNKDDELQVTMGVNLARGVSEEYIRGMAENWITWFKQAIEYKPEGH